MLKACLFGAAVTFALIAVPVVHFVTAIPSAFIGGFIAGSRAGATPGQALLIAVIMAVILVGPVFGAMFVSFVLIWGTGTSVVVGITAVFVLWIILLGTLGALLGGNSVRRQQAADQ